MKKKFKINKTAFISDIIEDLETNNKYLRIDDEWFVSWDEIEKVIDLLREFKICVPILQNDSVPWRFLPLEFASQHLPKEKTDEVVKSLNKIIQEEAH